MVVVKGVIEFNKWVKPICVKGINNIVMQPGSILEVNFPFLFIYAYFITPMGKLKQKMYIICVYLVK